jgi:hypothetical protein
MDATHIRLGKICECLSLFDQFLVGHSGQLRLNFLNCLYAKTQSCLPSVAWRLEIQYFLHW